MSDENMRAEFEAAYSAGVIYAMERTSSIQFVDIYKQRAWAAWQASRAAPARAAKPRLTGSNGGEFKFVAKWDGSDAHPTFEFHNGDYDMAGKRHIADLLIDISDWISEYAESIRTTPTRTGIIEAAGVKVKP